MKKRSSILPILWFYFSWLASLSANPVISGSSNLTPGTLGGGDIATFTFSFSNADTPESSAMTSSQLQVQWNSVLVNGVPKSFDVLSVVAAGGALLFDFGADGQITGMTLNHGALAKGATRTITATFQVPSAGLINNSTFQTFATLTWSQAPGILTGGSTATLHASPLLEISLAPVPPGTAPGGLIEYHADYQNTGTGVAHRAWMIVPINSNTHLVRVGAGSARPAVRFSTSIHPLEQVNSDSFVSEHFQPGILSDNGSPGDLTDDFWSFPSNTRMMAILLDDEELNLFPGGAGLQELVWQVRDNHSAVGTLVDQRLGYFCDELAFNSSDPQVTRIRLLPADIEITRLKNAIQLMFAGETGTSYFIQRSGDLNDWSAIGDAMETSPGFYQFEDASPLATHGFYRVARIINP